MDTLIETEEAGRGPESSCRAGARPEPERDRPSCDVNPP